MSASERTGWRDADLSRRHRRWGFHCPGVDLDFVLIEYHLGLPVALVEYKHHSAPGVDLEHPTYQALRALADRPPAIPLLLARYWPRTWAFEITSANAVARRLFGAHQSLSERGYVEALHQLRSLTVQEQVLRHLNETLPPVRASA